MNDHRSHALSGKTQEEITVAHAVDGTLSLDDLRIHPDTLRYQADQADAHHNPQLAANFRRAAELTDIEDEEVLALYDLLRPFRASSEELQAKADELAKRGLPLVAALFAEAADTYQRRHLGA